MPGNKGNRDSRTKRVSSGMKDVHDYGKSAKARYDPLRNRLNQINSNLNQTNPDPKSPNQPSTPAGELISRLSFFIIK